MPFFNKKLLNLSLASLLLALLTVPYIILPALAGYQVDPLRIEMKISPRQRVGTTVVTVRNPSDETIRLKAYVADWKLDENGGLMVLDEPPGPFSITQHVRFNPKEFELPPHQKQSVRMAIMLPPDAQDGEYHGMLFFEDLKTRTERMQTNVKGVNAAIEVKQRLGIAMYIYKGDVKPKVETGSFSCVPGENGKLKTEIVIHNNGNKHFRGTGSLFLTRKDAQESDAKTHIEIPVLDYKNLVIFPNSKLVINEIINTQDKPYKLTPGSYNVELNIAAKDHAITSLTKSVELIWPSSTKIKGSDTRTNVQGTVIAPGSDKL